MRVSIDFYFDKEDDGVSGSCNTTRDDVGDLYSLAQLLTDAVRGAGFSYVKDVGFEKEDGSITFGEI